MSQKWCFPLGPAVAVDGAPYLSSTTITDVSPAPQLVIPANSLEVGMSIRVTAVAKFSNTATPTLLTGIYYGGVAGTALAATSAITTTTSAVNWQIRLEYQGIVRAIGASGSIVGSGFCDISTSLTAFTHRPIPETAIAAVSVDTTASKAITMGATWGTNSASNTLTCVQFTVDIGG